MRQQGLKWTIATEKKNCSARTCSRGHPAPPTQRQLATEVVQGRSRQQEGTAVIAGLKSLVM
jgi:hypothetical protein